MASDKRPTTTASESEPSAAVIALSQPGEISISEATEPRAFISVEELTQPANLATVLAFPPGYLRAFTYNLAMEIAPEFGVEPSPQVTRIAMTSKRNLKRINNPDDVMSMPYAIVATRQRFNIYAGNY